MRQALLTILAATACFIFTAVPVSAADKSLQWERLDSEVTVQPNGDLRVVETNVIRFIGGPFTFGYRDINPSRLTRYRS